MQSVRVDYSFKAISVLLGAMLFANACSSGSETQASSFNSERRSGANALETYLDFPVTPEEWASVELAQGELIQQCMAEKGFDYTPFAASSIAVGQAIDGLVPGTAQYYEAYGYGHSTTLFAQQDLPGDLIGLPGPTEKFALVNPNELYRSGLSLEKALEYDKALTGSVGSTTGLRTELGSDAIAQAGACSAESLGFALAGSLRLETEKLIDIYNEDLASLVGASEPWAEYISTNKACLLEAELGVVARSLEVMINDPLSPDEAGQSVLRSVQGSINLDFAAHEADGFKDLRQSQQYEMAVADAVVSCGWDNRPVTYMAISADFEEQVWTSWQPEITAAKQRLDDAGWNLASL